MKIFFAALLAMMSFMNVACAEPNRNLSTSVNEFCRKYFGTLNRNENIFYSPYGINAALSILANGATGDTKAELLRALTIDNVKNLNDGHKIFSDFAAANYGETFAEANLLLIDKKVIGRGIEKNFWSVVTDVYKSEVREADFSGDINGERKKITRFVNDKTRGFIPDYKSIVTADTLTDLLNVVYFKGDWTFPFESRRTRRGDFTNRDGSKSTVDMMNQTFKEEISYIADENFCGIKLPYSNGAAMYLILPSDENSLDVAELWNNQTSEYREKFLDDLKRTPPFDGKVIVCLPKFELDIESNLVENLKSIGIKKSFTTDAEFFNIVNDTPLKIGNAKHRAKIKVDELGTEAAAVTEVVMLEGAAPGFHRSKIVYFIAERPFLFVIRDIESGVTLFAGAVNKF
ncbi:MAG: hypothetical protein IJ685_12150 [Selenomonadaceae bacterium]|nr:hypothetical protein [Selenomonadaceae bacterium]